MAAADRCVICRRPRRHRKKKNECGSVTGFVFESGRVYVDGEGSVTRGSLGVCQNGPDGRGAGSRFEARQ